jgi:DNA-binding transcriptional LysR family regulator
MYRPTQLDLVTQFLGELRLAVFAAKSYVARRGLPRNAAEFLEHEVVGMDQDTQIIDGFRKAGFTVERDFFPVRCDEQATHWELVRAGCGMGFAQRAIGARDPELVEVPIELDLPRIPVWLTAHVAIRQTPRVRRIWDLLAEGLRETIRAAG